MIRRALLIFLLLPGLAAAGWEFADSSKRVGATDGSFSLQLPSGWLYETAPNGVRASHDGMELNVIVVTITPHDKVFKAAKKQSTANSTPEDLSENYIADLQAGANAVRELTVLSNEPAELAGKPAFRVHYQFRAPASAGGALMEAVTIGTALDKGVMLMSLRAPAIHYFKRWSDKYEEAVKSLTLEAPPKPQH